jgi:hypothetical protein
MIHSAADLLAPHTAVQHIEPNQHGHYTTHRVPSSAPHWDSTRSTPASVSLSSSEELRLGSRFLLAPRAFDAIGWLSLSLCCDWFAMSSPPAMAAIGEQVAS